MFFSVIVPIYNVEKYLRRSIDSVLSQTFSDFELILVDDGSPDNCPKICDEYVQKDHRIKVVHKKNGGLVSARQAGISIAKGEYMFNLDADDAITPDALMSAHEIILDTKKICRKTFLKLTVAETNLYEDYISTEKVHGDLYRKLDLGGRIYDGNQRI